MQSYWPNWWPVTGGSCGVSYSLRGWNECIQIDRRPLDYAVYLKLHPETHLKDSIRKYFQEITVGEKYGTSNR